MSLADPLDFVELGPELAGDEKVPGFGEPGDALENVFGVRTPGVQGRG
jgi:hypothetical protein